MFKLMDKKIKNFAQLDLWKSFRNFITFTICTYVQNSSVEMLFSFCILEDKKQDCSSNMDIYSVLWGL